MAVERLLQLLSNIYPLPKDFADDLKKELRSVAYPKGQYLVQEHSPAAQAYFLAKGFCVSYHFQDGNRIVTGFWKEDEIVISPKSFFDQTPANEIIQLTTNSVLLAISYQSVEALLQRYAVANFLARSIITDCHANCKERIVDLHYLGAWDRYLKLLKHYPGIELHVSQDFIASYLNITPQSLSRLKAEHH